MSITVTYRFTAPPRAADNDEIRDTISYDDLSRALGGYFANREYRLIERVATDAYNIARELARSSAAVAVTVHKLRPPVANLAGGAAYTCGDFPS